MPLCLSPDHTVQDSNGALLSSLEGESPSFTFSHRENSSQWLPRNLMFGLSPELPCFLLKRKKHFSFYPHAKVFPGTLMAHSRNIGEKNGFHQLTDLYMSRSSNVFSLFLISKTVSPGASLGVIMLSLPHVSFLCFLIIFVGMSSLLIVSFLLYFLILSPGSSFPACH